MGERQIYGVVKLRIPSAKELVCIYNVEQNILGVLEAYLKQDVPC